MIARLLAGLGLILALSAAAPGQDWTRTARMTSAGGVLVGNPAAKARLVEIASYTCPHCAAFARDNAATLAAKIRSGTLAVEYRPIITEPAGLAATIVARCAAGGFHAANDTLYARQTEWFWQARSYAQANAGRLAAYPELDQIRLIAERGGIVAAAGLAADRATACFADRGQLDAAVRASDAAGRIADSTPTFVIGGETLPGAGWPVLAAKLRAAGMK